IAAIRAAGFADDVRVYFARARTNQYAVNPYWPRGSCLSSACLFIDSAFAFSFDEYLAFERAAGASAAHQDAGFLAWIKELPAFLRRVQAHSAYPPIRDSYQAVVASRMEGYRAAIAGIERSLREFGCSSDGWRIVFVPNLLQARSMADFVTQGNTTYVITTHPNTTTILHEHLHPIVGQYRGLWAAYAASANLPRLVDSARLTALGYMWDASPEARMRALEESAVRGLTAVLASWVEEMDLQEYGRWNAESGFVLVPAIIAQAKQQKPTADNLEAYFRAAIESYLADQAD
ncbi:MAG: hypothetical protein GX552_09355, partial [Chloroflexi bacterium]|nr:hypothetical protein [Chloroflexota bacterium]